MIKLFDSHCHPHFAAYEKDRDEMIQRAISQGVAMIAVGTSLETSKSAVALAKKYPGSIWATVGIHPNHTSSSPHDPLETKLPITDYEASTSDLLELAKLPEVVAIGETGLDYHYLKPVPGDDQIVKVERAQRESFLRQIELAKEVKKPLVIHARKAYRDVFEILCDALFEHGIVMHFFQGSIREAEQFLELGAYLSFAGPITFTNEYDSVIKYVPLERMVVETDAPYAAPMPHRGQRNEPAYLKFIIEKIAALKALPFDEVREALSQNAKKFFRIN
jgi:TatD DNase family protein